MTENKTPLLIPSGVQISQSEGGINLEYSGDIELHSDLGAQFHTIQSHNGNIILHYPAKAHTIYAPNGTITTNASLQATEISAHEVHVGGDLKSTRITCSNGHLQINGRLNCSEAFISGNCNILGSTSFETIVAEGDVNLVGDAKGDTLETTGRIHLMGVGTLENIEMAGSRLLTDQKLTCGKITALNATVTLGEGSNVERIQAGHLFLSGQRNDIKVIQLAGELNIGPGEIHSVITTANSINLDPETRGKIMVLETNHEPGPHLVKGCLQISDMKQLLPNSDAFFKQYQIADEPDITNQIPLIDTTPIDNPFSEEHISEHLQKSTDSGSFESLKVDKDHKNTDTQHLIADHTVEEVAVSNENKSLNSDSEEIHEPSWDEPVHEAETGGPSDANHDLEAANHEINSEPPLLDENPDSEIEESEAEASLTGEAEIQIKSDSLLPETDIQAIPHEDEGLGEEAQFPEALVEESDSSESDLENLNKQQEIQDLFDENPKGSFQDAPVSPQENDAEEQLKANISIAAIQEENIDSVLEISDELPENLSIELDSEEDLADDVAVPNILDEEIEGNSPPVSLEGNIVSEEHQLLHEQLDIIEKYYANATPDAVQQLHNAIHFGDPQNLMGDITTIFALLNKHHQRINSRMHPQVVHSFNIIHQHVQSLSL